jgi:hypothetical protein
MSEEPWIPIVALGMLAASAVLLAIMLAAAILRA